MPRRPTQTAGTCLQPADPPAPGQECTSRPIPVLLCIVTRLPRNDCCPIPSERPTGADVRAKRTSLQRVPRGLHAGGPGSAAVSLRRQTDSGKPDFLWTARTFFTRRSAGEPAGSLVVRRPLLARCARTTYARDRPRARRSGGPAPLRRPQNSLSCPSKRSADSVPPHRQNVLRSPKRREAIQSPRRPCGSPLRAKPLCTPRRLRRCFPQPISIGLRRRAAVCTRRPPPVR